MATPPSPTQSLPAAAPIWQKPDWPKLTVAVAATAHVTKVRTLLILSGDFRGFLSGRGDKIFVRRFLPAFLLLAVVPALAQTVLHLKTRSIVPPAGAAVEAVDSPVRFDKGHLILQFDHPVSPDLIGALEALDVHVMGGIPENGVLVTLSRRVMLTGLGVVYAAPVDPADKMSPLISAGDPAARNGYYLVEFYADTDSHSISGAFPTLGGRRHASVAHHRFSRWN